MTDVEETIERIKGQKGVEGFFIVDDEGTLLRCKRLSKEYATELAADIVALVKQSQHCVRDIDATNKLQFFRMRSRDMEVLAAPGDGFIVVTLQRWMSTPQADLGPGDDADE